ncbi:copper amine oxidase N-terminal domain-containing protein [Natranaerobius trueperi]|uniref:Copper amine oxidase-like N-terminal domain-containing protein n=1 Tax=Natranaerobius trueperi TaxID=759412 RepID=A0A226BZ52_9FIRM|nr:copper amine oxidase N-terminal domain-containing protein [Natranaerobius trueperi]OWZ83410.1 hypothetical protein CDO51_08925 [Natranaerobius trueperi]
MRKVVILLLIVFIVLGGESSGHEELDTKKESVWIEEKKYIKEPGEIIDKLHRLGIDRVYLNVADLHDKYLLKNNPELYNKFIKLANKTNIEVEAWVLKRKENNLIHETKKVLDLNNQFDGIHLEVEPHILEKVYDNEKELLKQLSFNLKEVSKTIEEHDTKLSLNVKLLPCYLEYNVEDIINLVDEVSLMNKKESSKEFINKGKEYLQFFDNYNTKVNIGTEFQPNKKGTVYDFDNSQLKKRLIRADKKFSEFNNYSGMSYHTLEYFYDWVDKNSNIETDKKKLILSPNTSEGILNNSTIEIDTPPVIKDGRTYIPVRGVFDQFGVNITWNNDSKKVILLDENTKVELKIGSELSIVNDQKVTMDSSPQILDGRTLIPLRFALENLGFQVDWHPQKEIIKIIETN